jgi:hypothetical protein
MFRTPLQNAELSRMESCGVQQLLGIFEYYLKTGVRGVDYGQLPDAWGTLFSEKYLSAEELVDSLQGGEHRLGEDKELMLREFIRGDCAAGGPLVLSIIKKGGKIDRAALIMIADPADLAALENSGTTALHLLADACDKGVRPAFIARAGKKLLSGVYDRRGIPVLISIFSLGDLCSHDLKAIEKIFSREELHKVMCSNRTGKTGLVLFSELARSLRGHSSRDRNSFSLNTAVRSTNSGGGIRAQTNSSGNQGRGIASPVKTDAGRNGEQGDPGRSASDPFSSMISDPLDNIGLTMKRGRPAR